MSETRRFRVLKDMMVSMGYPKIIPSETILSLTDLGVVNGFNSFWCNEYKFIIKDLKAIIKMGYLEEILPDKKPISSEENTNIEDDIYSKKYNIYEILTLIPNLPKDSKFECSLNEEVWESNHNENELCKVGRRYCDDMFLNDYHSLKDILEATYTIVKPVEEVKEKWVRIASKHGLCREIVNGKTIKVNGYILEKDYTDDDIENMFDQLQYGLVEYLEEN